MSSSISKFYKSFSGTDTIAFIMLPDSKPIALGTLTTVSYSVYRTKKPVINIGRVNINGITRGSRIYAGTMVFTVVNQHWLREVQDALPWLKRIKELKSDELPLFDIMIASANEYGGAVAMYIYGIDFTDEAQVLSTQDLYTENTFSFVARDLSTFDAFDVQNGSSPSESSDSRQFVVPEVTQKFYIMHEDTDWRDFMESDRLYLAAKALEHSKRTREAQTRTLYWSPSIDRPLMGDDVAQVQNFLKGHTKTYDLSKDQLGVYTDYTADNVRLFQIENGITPTGIVDQRTYTALASPLKGTDTRNYATCINVNGAYVFPKADRNYSLDGLEKIGYGEMREYSGIVSDLNDSSTRFYVIDSGYVLIQDMFSTENQTLSYSEYPNLMPGDYGHYVNILQELLKAEDETFTNYQSGYFDETTEKQVEKVKQKYDIEIDTNNDNNNNSDEESVGGSVTYEVWLELLSNADPAVLQSVVDNTVIIKESSIPKRISVDREDIFNALNDIYVEITTEGNFPIKATIISYFKEGKTKTLSKTYEAEGTKKIGFKDLETALIYSPDYGPPEKAELFIYPHNKEAHKWCMQIEDEVK